MPKLVNGRIDTATMTRLLRRHPSWTATARRGPVNHEMKWAMPVGGKTPALICLWKDDVAWEELGFAHVSIDPPKLDNWRIHRPASERPPRAKPKPASPSTTVHLGIVTLGTSGAIKTSDGDERVMDEMFALPDGEWVVEARRK